MRKVFCLFAIVLCFLPSCSLFLKKAVYRSSQPKVTDIASTRKRWAEVGTDIETFFHKVPLKEGLSDSAYIVNVNKALSFDGELFKGAMVFDASGRRVDIFKGKICLGKTDTFLKEIKKGQDYDTLPGETIDKYLCRIDNQHRQAVKVEQNYDFLVIIPWADWLGVSKQDARNWIRFAKSNKDINFLIMPVNLDITNEWYKAEKIAKFVKFKF
jgi:hypothetical protein